MIPAAPSWAVAFEVDGPRLRVWNAAGVAGTGGVSQIDTDGDGDAGGAAAAVAIRGSTTVLAEAGRHSQRLAEAVLLRGSRPVHALMPPIPAVVVVHDATTGELEITTSASPGSSLVYLPTGAGNWVFANHLPTLFERTGQHPPIDPAAMAAWLIVARGSGTVYRDVRWVPAGAALTLRPGNAPRIAQWVSVDCTPAAGTVEQFVEQYCAALDDVLAVEAPADGDVSVLMSAGLDSTMVAGSLAGVVGAERTVFSYCLDPEPLPGGVSASPAVGGGWLYSDFPDALAMGRTWPNVEVEPLGNAAGRTWLDVLPEYFAATASPVFNPANAIWMYEAYLRASERGHRLLFTGQSGNRTFSWQPPRALRSLLLARKPGALIGAMRAHSEATGMPMWLEAGRLVSQVAPWTRELVGRGGPIGRGRFGGARRRGARPNEDSRQVAERIAAASYLAPGAIDRLGLGDAIARSALNPEAPWFYPAYFGLGVSLPQDPVPNVRMADPLAALPLVQIVSTLPAEAFVGVADGRSFARRTMRGRVPDSIRLRTARGLQAPDARRWMPSREQVDAALAAAGKQQGIAEAIDVPRLRQDMVAPTGSPISSFGSAQRALGAVLLWLWREDLGWSRGISPR